jgi:hypothetical protein
VDSGGPADGLVAHFRFDEIVDDGTYDVLDGRPATCSACPGVVAGAIGSALEFDGTQSLSIADDPVFHIAEGTIALWVRHESVEQYQAIVSKAFGTGTANSWEVYLSDVFALVGQKYSDGPHVLVGPTIDNADFVHVALTFDDDGLLLFIGGDTVASKDASGSPQYDDSEVTIAVGFDNQSPVNHYRGSLDDLRIYNRPLAESEIAELATARDRDDS